MPSLPTRHAPEVFAAGASVDVVFILASDSCNFKFALVCYNRFADVAQALLPAGAETLLGAGEQRSPNACPACARPLQSQVIQPDSRRWQRWPVTSPGETTSSACPGERSSQMPGFRPATS